jgi:hypothetical protein
MQVFLGLVAAILIASGITVILIRENALNEKTYTEPLADEDAYNTIISEAYEGSEANEDLDPFAQDFVKQIFQQEEISRTLQKSVEGTIKYALDYLKGNEDRLYLYFPREDLENYLDKEKIINLALEVFDKRYANYDELLICKDPYDINPFAGRLAPVLTCRISNADSKSELKELFRTEIEKEVEKYTLEEILKQADLSFANEKTPSEDLLKLSGNERKDYIDSLNFAKKLSVGILIIGIIAIAVGAIIGFLANLFGKVSLKSTLVYLSWLTIFIGLFIALIAGGSLFTAKFVLVAEDFLNEETLGFENTNLITEILRRIATNLFQNPTIIGLLVFVAGIISRVVFGLIPESKKRNEAVQEG